MITIKHLGDITKIDGSQIEPVDVITAGSPCQDLSVAGKRAGLEGERSGLFMEQMRIIKEMRNADKLRGRADEFIRPRYLVWENVPGSLSSPGMRNGENHKGEDFQAVLTEIVKVTNPNAPDVPLPEDRKWAKQGSICGVGEDGIPFSVAWKLHDAQYYGVPQRRKRICVLADFNGLTAAGILLEPQLERTSERGEPYSLVRGLGRGDRPEVQSLAESVSGDTDQSESERQGTTGDTENGIGKSVQE